MTTLDVKVMDDTAGLSNNDLVELPPTNFYSLCGVTALNCAPSPNHPLTHSGTVLMITNIEAMAAMYFTLMGNQQLGINDVSLPKGGLFDVGSGWNPLHKDHRVGKAVDINRTTIAPDGSGPQVSKMKLIEYGDEAGLRVIPEWAPVCSDGTPANPCFHAVLIQ